jgi:Flp pilus assembly protein TadB
LRAGGTLRDGLGAAATGPFGPLLRSVVAHADAGAGLRDALAAYGRRHPSPELSLAFGAMALALQTGAAHAATLEVVAQRTRERIALAREIRAMSASARASATVVAIAPLAFGLLVLAVDRSVLAHALASGAGRACLPVGLAFEAVGVCWMRHLLRRPLWAPQPHVGRDDLPETVDLLALGLASGLGVTASITAAAPHAPGASGRALRVASARITAGAAPAHALAPWHDVLGDDVRPLVAALLAAHHDGAPAGEALDRIAADLRHARRQRAVERVQRLPVLLLFPLVCCVLPAFVLLTVVPLALGSIGALRA